VLVSAPPADAPSLLPATQIVRGNDSSAEASLRQGGSVILSRAIAEEHHLRIGQTVTLPTPNPVGLRLAALSTNLGWAPGAVILNSSDYERAWNTQDITAYGVRLDRGTTPQIAAIRIAAALQPQPGLAVETSARHTAGRNTVSREALARLSQVATMIPIAAVLAIVAALAAMIWQTRPRLARLILEGLPRGVLLRSILLEGALLAGTGGLTGAMFGIYGKTLVDHALSSTINFPVYHATPLTPTLAALALLTVPTLAMLSLPAHITTRRITPALALAD
jgi:putative ABC transport system permease protein